MRTVTVQQRRRAMVRRHHLGGDAADPEAVTRALLALHATDPASVYLSVLARGAGEPAATLLPALDPTPMGWKHRDWFFGIDRRLVFDRAGNIGPTLWWDGEITGCTTGSTARSSPPRSAPRWSARSSRPPPRG